MTKPPGSKHTRSYRGTKKNKNKTKLTNNDNDDDDNNNLMIIVILGDFIQVKTRMYTWLYGLMNAVSRCVYVFLL